jgi:16S rRNA A1518/A1519 N6-dimethyltransferase RsmA/KsgA/DIM1 with predicted DNA glycosylase/AP lyase activity
VISRIARAINPGPADHLLEIGPGRGALTHLLLEAEYATFDAV